MNKQTLETIKNAKLPDTEEGKIYAEMREEIGKITNNLTEPAAISATKVDAGSNPDIHSLGVTKKMYEDYFGSTMRSEEDAAKNLADYCAAQSAVTPEKPKGSDDKAKQLQLAKAKMKMAAARLKLMTF